MKWLLSLLCFTTISAFSQVDNPLLEKLKTTKERLKGKSPNNIPNPGLDFQLQGKKPFPNTNPPLAYVVPNERNQLNPIVPESERTGRPGKIPNAARSSDFKPQVIAGNEEIMVLALPQDNMPCIVPNMKLFKPMPGVNDRAIAENQKPFKLVLPPKPKS